MFLSVLLLTFSLTSICEAVTQKEPSIFSPRGPFHLFDGDALNVTCTWKGKDKVPNIIFSNMGDGEEIKNTTRLTVIYKKNKAKKTATGTFTFNPVYVTDKLKSVQCKNLDTSKSEAFHFFVIRKSTAPNITISDGSMINLKKGENLTITCIISYVITNNVKNVSVTWRWSPLSQEVLLKNIKGTETWNGTIITSKLHITNGGLQNERTYYCVAMIQYDTKIMTVMKYNKYIKVKVTHESGIQSYMGELTIFTGEVATLDCKVSGIPRPTVKWMRNDKLITAATDNRYSFNSTGKDSPLNVVLKVRNVAFKDRAKYKCFATYLDRNVTKVYTLRVRDPLGPLWPVLGMFVEAILLIIVIGACEKFGKKKEKEGKKTFADKDDDGEGKDVDDAGQTSEAAPLVESSEKEINTVNA